MSNCYLQGQGSSQENRFLFDEYTGWLFGDYQPNYTYTNSSFTSSQNSIITYYPFTIYNSARLNNGVVTLSGPIVVTNSNVNSINFYNKWYPSGTYLYRIDTTYYTSNTQRQLQMNGYYRVIAPDWTQKLGDVFSKNPSEYPDSPEDGPWTDGYYYQKKTSVDEW